jgi:hypothetical protein
MAGWYPDYERLWDFFMDDVHRYTPLQWSKKTNTTSWGPLSSPLLLLSCVTYYFIVPWMTKKYIVVAVVYTATTRWSNKAWANSRNSKNVMSANLDCRLIPNDISDEFANMFLPCPRTAGRWRWLYDNSEVVPPVFLRGLVPAELCWRINVSPLTAEINLAYSWITGAFANVQRAQAHRVTCQILVRFCNRTWAWRFKINTTKTDGGETRAGCAIQWSYASIWLVVLHFKTSEIRNLAEDISKEVKRSSTSNRMCLNIIMIWCEVYRGPMRNGLWLRIWEDRTVRLKEICPNTYSFNSKIRDALGWWRIKLSFRRYLSSPNRGFKRKSWEHCFPLLSWPFFVCSTNLVVVIWSIWLWSKALLNSALI